MLAANWTTGKSSRFLKRALWSAIVCCKTSCWNWTRGDILLPYRSQRSLKLVQCTTKTLGAFLPCTKQTSCWHVALPRWMCPAMLPRFSWQKPLPLLSAARSNTRDSALDAVWVSFSTQQRSHRYINSKQNVFYNHAEDPRLLRRFKKLSLYGFVPPPPSVGHVRPRVSLQRANTIQDSKRSPKDF